MSTAPHAVPRTEAASQVEPAAPGSDDVPGGDGAPAPSAARRRIDAMLDDAPAEAREWYEGEIEHWLSRKEWLRLELKKAEDDVEAGRIAPLEDFVERLATIRRREAGEA